MIDPEFIRSLSHKAAGLFPPADKARARVEAELQTLLQQSLGHLPLASREAFIAQQERLERALERIAMLEAKLAELEQRLGV